MSAFEHELHAAEISEGCPAPAVRRSIIIYAPRLHSMSCDQGERRHQGRRSLLGERRSIDVGLVAGDRGAASTVPGCGPERLRVVDWQQPENNDFLLVSQFSVTGALYTCRPDLVGFVNGLPLSSARRARGRVQEIDLAVCHRSGASSPATCCLCASGCRSRRRSPPKPTQWSNQAVRAAIGRRCRAASPPAIPGAARPRARAAFPLEEALPVRRERADAAVRTIRGDKQRVEPEQRRNLLLDLVENFTLFSEHKGGLVKILSQNHQFLGVNNAIASMLEARERGHGRAGVFWQTQGSGKSFSMVFFAQKVLRRVEGNWTFVVVTDRVELDDQIAKTFKNHSGLSAARTAR
jgi:type I restriction enzyme, R subunit